MTGIHLSSCAVHNEPAYPKGKCDCHWAISGEALSLIKAALLAPTHEANDYNCEDWPIGEGCAGCKGDKLREAAIKAVDDEITKYSVYLRKGGDMQ